MVLKDREEICEKVLELSRTPRQGVRFGGEEEFILWYHPAELLAFKAGDTSVLFETPSFVTYEEFGGIVDAMVKKGFEVDAMFDSNDSEWEVCFGKKMGREPTWTAHHLNLATATARAALACVEEK